MTTALDSHARRPVPPTRARNRWVPLAPAALLTVGMLGFAWVQVSAEADRSSTAHIGAAPPVLAVSAIRAGGDTSTTMPPGPTRQGTTTAQSQQQSPKPNTERTSVAAPVEDAVPSLEDQELASYATCGA